MERPQVPWIKMRGPKSICLFFFKGPQKDSPALDLQAWCTLCIICNQHIYIHTIPLRRHNSAHQTLIPHHYYTILCYAMLCYTMLCYAMLCYTILYYTILYYTILYYTILYYTILYYTILYYTILYYTILYYTILYYTILCSTVQPWLMYSERLREVLELGDQPELGGGVVSADGHRGESCPWLHAQSSLHREKDPKYMI